MRWDPAHPDAPGSDRLVLSEGHAVPIVYAACTDLGVTVRPGDASRPMTMDDLLALRSIDSFVDGHPNPMLGFPFFDAATGSLGQGLSVAAGLAAAARIDGSAKAIYCIIGDGEAREGQIWEAMDFIADHGLSSVVALFNCNASARATGSPRPGLAVPGTQGGGVRLGGGRGRRPRSRRDRAGPAGAADLAGGEAPLRDRPHRQGLGRARPRRHGASRHPVTAGALDAALAALDARARALGVADIDPRASAAVLTIAPPPAPPVSTPATERSGSWRRSAAIRRSPRR